MICIYIFLCYIFSVNLYVSLLSSIRFAYVFLEKKIFAENYYSGIWNGYIYISFTALDRGIFTYRFDNQSLPRLVLKIKWIWNASIWYSVYANVSISMISKCINPCGILRMFCNVFTSAYMYTCKMYTKKLKYVHHTVST